MNRYEQAASCLKTLAHPARLEMIRFLIDLKKATVGQISEHAKLAPHVTSEHLSLLKNKGLLSSHRAGKNTVYEVCEPMLFAIMECIEHKFQNKENVS